MWEIDEATGDRLLATLNALRGEDDPLRRATLIATLTEHTSASELAQLLPEDERAIGEALSLLDFDLEACLAELEAAAARAAELPVSVTFAIPRENVAEVELALERALTRLDGANRRGRALALICRRYLEAADA